MDRVTLTVEGQPVSVPVGAPVVAALLLADLPWTRRCAVTDAPRLPWCMMGACLDCLVTIDDVADRLACLTPARQGMRVVRQAG